MDNWSRMSGSEDGIDFSSLKFYIGDSGADRYSITGEKSICISSSGRGQKMAVVGWVSGYYGAKGNIHLVVKNNVIAVSDDHLYNVDINNFYQISAQEILDAPDDFFDPDTNIDMVRDIANRKINYQSRMEADNIMNGICVVNDIECNAQAIQQEMIAKVDKKTLINVYANYLRNRERSESYIEAFLLKWAEAKYRLYVALGNNLELTKEFEYEMTCTQLKSQMQEILKSDPLGSVINYTIQSVYGNINPKGFYIEGSDPISAFFPMNSEVSISKYLNICGIPDTAPVKKGIDKLMGNATTKGVIHVSIDPIAYLMQSTNKNNWGSCHGWTGGTSQGSISYTFDNHSFVTFLCNEEMVKYKKGDAVEKGEFCIMYPFTWYSMKNRMMVYLDTATNVFQTSRLYPQGETWEVYEKEVRTILEATLSSVCGITNDWKINRNALIADESRGLYNDGANGFNSNIVKHKDYVGTKPSICIGATDYIRNMFTN